MDSHRRWIHTTRWYTRSGAYTLVQLDEVMFRSIGHGAVTQVGTTTSRRCDECYTQPWRERCDSQPHAARRWEGGSIVLSTVAILPSRQYRHDFQPGVSRSTEDKHEPLNSPARASLSYRPTVDQLHGTRETRLKRHLDDAATGKAALSRTRA
jgi:hypothetical protein